MDRNQRPHSRDKVVGHGSAGVNHGHQVNTGNRPVGFGGRNEGGGGHIPTGANANRPQGNGYGYNQQPQRSGIPIRLGGKSLLGLIVAVIVVVFLLKSCGGLSSFNEIIPNEGYDPIDSGNSSAVNTDYSYTSSYGSPDLSVSNQARAKRVIPVGGGRDKVTIMVYMCGTDLESKYGMATKDLQEMLNAKMSDQVNLIIETGGCSKWQNNVMSNTNNQIYKVENGKLRRLENNVGNAAMTDPDNLETFIKYCTKNYPADRNMLIFWDHGGGSLTGYGYDEKNPRASSMTLSKINDALSGANCVFDCIGFDACLMATLETAMVCNEYADYMIASEETEPGTGWYYTDWLTKLSQNTSMPTVEIAQCIIDTFVSSSSAADPRAQVTLSVIDLAELQGTVPSAFRDFSTSTTTILNSGDYKLVSDARAGVRQFAQGNGLNQVDLIDLAQRLGTDEAKDLANALQGCVKYNKSTMSRCYGVSIFFPYESTSSVNSALASYQDLGIDSEYAKCIQSFASLETGGQIAGTASQNSFSSGISGSDMLQQLLQLYLSGSGGSSTSPLNALSGGSAGYGLDPSLLMSLLGGFSGRSMPGEYSWVDTDLIANHAESLSANYLDPSRLVATRSGGKNVLQLTDAEWSLIQTVELNVFVPDGDGYIDLGLDNTFDWYGDDLLLEYDGTWLTLNGNVCAYYLVSDTQKDDGSWVTVGRIPALLNGELVNLRVVFDDANPAGTVTGAYPLYEDETDTIAKGDIAIEAGDTIELLCDYYDLDGNYSASYTLGTKFTVPQSGLELYNLTLDVDEYSPMFRITDIYGNHYWLAIED